ncbi:DUF416 family protein [Flavobacterium sp. F52]|uniref:DUF416 family protein n=1 Tax=Flavobacterium sp. F52 TaxID=1202532 RepID=UPI000272E844|nr:DUF416 family protein [Flavobacterium sp. F52]EJF99014.1 hypothetical protein FF52_22959 [Flavobacterium sp. F52]
MDEYRDTISEKLAILNDEKKVIFSLLICERLFPNYVFFSIKYSFGNPSELKEIISTLYRDLLDKRKSSKIDNYIEIVEKITPDTEDYDTILASFALDACTSILSTLYFLKDDDFENIVDVATYARDTVDMFIQERDDLDINDSQMELLIEKDPFMQRELKRQFNVLDYLNNIDSDSLSEIDLSSLRQLAKDDIIDISLLNSI